MTAIATRRIPTHRPRRIVQHGKAQEGQVTRLGLLAADHRACINSIISNARTRASPNAPLASAPTRSPRSAI